MTETFTKWDVTEHLRTREKRIGRSMARQMGAESFAHSS